MTFADIKTAIKDYCTLTSPEADTRVGNAINRHYRRITASIGLDATRFVTRTQATTDGVQTVTFSSIEKIDRVLDTTSGTTLLQEVSVHELRSVDPGTGPPARFAILNTEADRVTILLDTLPQSTYTLKADGQTTLSDLTASDSPAFQESYHDILIWYVIAEELLKKEKDKLSGTYKSKADELLAALRWDMADSPTLKTQQASASVSPLTGSSGGGAGSLGETAYTQSTLVTFDLGASTAPFAVAQSSATYVANLGAEFLGNITTDRLIGRDSNGTGETEQLTVGGGLEFTGSGGIQIADSGITSAKIAAGAIVDSDVNASAAITWTKISKTGSSLADLTTRSAADLSSGTIAEARLGSGTGTVNKVLRGDSTWGDAPGVTTNGSSAVQQIAFAATQSASSGANVLDDYEEGTWTPADGSGAALTLTSVSGHYVKIGQMVQAFFTFTYPSNGSASSATISGLPFTSKTDTATGGGLIAYTTYSATGVTLQVNSNATTASFFNMAGAAIQNTDFDDRVFTGVLIYRASA